MEGNKYEWVGDKNYDSKNGEDNKSCKFHNFLLYNFAIVTLLKTYDPPQSVPALLHSGSSMMLFGLVAIKAKYQINNKEHNECCHKKSLYLILDKFKEMKWCENLMRILDQQVGNH